MVRTWKLGEICTARWECDKPPVQPLVSVWSDSRLIGYVGLKTWKKAGEWKTEEAGALGAKKVEELPSFRQTPPYVSMHMQHVRRRYQAAHLLAWPELRCMRTLWLLGTCLELSSS